MKKFKILYMLIFIFIAIMILTDGVPGNLNIYSYNYADYGWTDGLQGNLYLSIINCFVILIIIMFMTLLTFNRKNKTKNKIIVFLGFIILALLIPIGKDSYSGGIEGLKGENDLFLWNLPFYIME